jgi:hypothetical protein
VSCGCSNDSATPGAPLLTGQLDSSFANASSSAAPQQEGLLGEFSSKGFSLAGVVVAGLLVALVFGGAWLLDRTKKD